MGLSCVSMWQFEIRNFNMKMVKITDLHLPDLTLSLFQQALVYPEGAANGTKGIWMEAKAHGVAAPDCREAHFSRDNHLGNGLNGNPNVYNWTIPSDFVHERCALRMRYVVVHFVPKYQIYFLIRVKSESVELFSFLY